MLSGLLENVGNTYKLQLTQGLKDGLKDLDQLLPAPPDPQELLQQSEILKNLVF